MNQQKIGKFIQECRKNKNLTQENLAEKLGVSDRAVSKWERGINLPDASLMLDLSNILEISVNELLTGEKINKEEYKNIAENNLIEFAKKEEIKNKKFLFYENIITIMFLIVFVYLFILIQFVIQEINVKIITAIVGFLILIIAVYSNVKIETEEGYYECSKCNHKYIPNYKDVFFAMHMGRTRYLKCPKCNKHSWNKKVLK